MEGVWGEALSRRRIKARDLDVEREAGYLNMCTGLKFHEVIFHTYMYMCTVVCSYTAVRLMMDMNGVG